MDDIQVGHVYTLANDLHRDRWFTVRELRKLTGDVVLEDSLKNTNGTPYVHIVHVSTLLRMLRVEDTNALPYSHRC